MKKLLRRSCGAFTMAEILISLTIIGVIAAITLPSLRANINEKTWATQKKALFSRMNQAIAMLDSVNTYTDAQTFITNGLSSVLKINNICDHDGLTDCGVHSGSIINMAGSAVSMPNLWTNLGVTSFTTAGQNPGDPAIDNDDLVGAFETANGESVMVFYNPRCIPDDDAAPTATTQPDMLRYICANLIFDLNQDKGPNTVGKDIGFMTVFYAADPIVSTAIPNSAASTTISSTASCPDDYRLPTLPEATSLQLNWNILGGDAVTSMLSSSRAVSNGNTYIYSVSNDENFPRVATQAATPAGTTRCVKR